MCFLLLSRFRFNSVFTVTAAGRGQLKSLPLGKLKKYADAYNIQIDRAVEKDDIIDGIMGARVSGWDDLYGLTGRDS